MEKLKWVSNYNTNFDIVDEQHKRFLNHVNLIIENLKTGDGVAIKKIIDQLISSLRLHFDTEKKLMQKYKYLGFFSHNAEHDRFANKTFSILESAKSNNTLLTDSFFKSLLNWFENHLEINDRKMCDYIKSKTN